MQSCGAVVLAGPVVGIVLNERLLVLGDGVILILVSIYKSVFLMQSAK